MTDREQNPKKEKWEEILEAAALGPVHQRPMSRLPSREGPFVVFRLAEIGDDGARQSFVRSGDDGAWELWSCLELYSVGPTKRVTDK